MATVNTDSDASSINDLMLSDPEFSSLRLNSLMVSRVPDEIIAIDDLDEDEWTQPSLQPDDTSDDEEEELDEPYGSVQILELSKSATANRSGIQGHQAHLDGGSQASTTHEKSILWGYREYTDSNPCRVKLLCADGKEHIVPKGYGTVRIPARNQAGYVPILCYYTPQIPNFIVSPSSFGPLVGKGKMDFRGYTIDTFEAAKKFTFTAKHKKQSKQDVLVHGVLKGGLCYTLPVFSPSPAADSTWGLTLKEANAAGVTVLEDHPDNSWQNEFKLHQVSAKEERLLWHQRLGHCSDEKLTRASEFADGVPKINVKKSVIDNCGVCMAAKSRARDRGDGVTRTATRVGQGLSIDFAFAGQHSKNSKDPDRYRENDYLGYNGETCYLLVYDHFPERLDGVCRQSKAPPVAWLRRWLRNNVEDDVKDRYVYMDQGGELYKCKAIRDLFEREFGYTIHVTGAEAHHQNGLVERANMTVDNAIRSMLFGAGLPIRFWPFAFYYYLRIKNAALPRSDVAQSAYQKVTGKKDDLSGLRTFGCRLWVKVLAWRNRAKYVLDTKKGILLGYRTRTLKNVIWYDPATDRVKYGYHVRFDEGYNDLPLSKLPPNVLLLDRHEARAKPETVTVTIPPFQTSAHPFFTEHEVTVTVKCDHPTYGFVLKEDDCLMRVYVSAFTSNTKRPAQQYSCNTIGSTERATVRKFRGAYITAINDEAIATMEQAMAVFARLRSEKVDSFTMTLAQEPKPSAQTLRRAADELERPGFDLDESLGEDFFATNDDSGNDPSSLSPSGASVDKSQDEHASHRPQHGDRITKEFKGGAEYHGTIVSGPHTVTVEGKDVLVWKVQYDDGDQEEMTAVEIAQWKMPTKEVSAGMAAKGSSGPSGDRPEDFDVEQLPIPADDTGAPTHRRRSTRIQERARETARMHFLETNPYLPMDSISMYEAATCRIHLCDDDPYEDLLHNVDEVEVLLSDPKIVSAIHRLLDPDEDMDGLRVNALQSETISPEERALPRFSRRALKRLPTWDLWHKNELEQLDQMHALGMFGAPQKLPEGGILMRFHWQYRIKVNGKRRSRLCCDGSPRAAPQVHSTTSTYASCLEHPIFRLFVALCAADGLTIYGGDAKDAFAHSPGPSKPTFMKLDDAFVDWYKKRTGVTLERDLVMPVLRALQGHPEAAKLWEAHISGILSAVGFRNTTHEKNIYTGTFYGEKVLMVRQVDDFALGCKSESVAKRIYAQVGAKLMLHNEDETPFEYLGLVDSFDGYDVLQTRDYIKVSAESYIRRLLKAHSWDNPSPREASRKPKPPLHESDVAALFNQAAGPVENTPEHKQLEAQQGFSYRSVLGEILFAYVLCRADIGYAVTTLAKFSTAPNELHYKSLKHLAIYLRQTQDWGILYWRSEPVLDLPSVPYITMTFDDALPLIPPPTSLHQLVTHVDAAHANELKQRRSTTGYGCCLAGGVVAYRSRTQSICAQSSTEAELIAANSAAKVTKYLRFILHELGYTQQEPTPIYEDNDSAIKIVNHNRPTDRSRHIEIRYFALQHWRLLKDIVMIHLPGVVNPADMLTKALGWVLHHRHAPYLMGHYGNPCR